MVFLGTEESNGTGVNTAHAVNSRSMTSPLRLPPRLHRCLLEAQGRPSLGVPSRTQAPRCPVVVAKRQHTAYAARRRRTGEAVSKPIVAENSSGESSHCVDATESVASEINRRGANGFAISPRRRYQRNCIIQSSTPGANRLTLQRRCASSVTTTSPSPRRIARIARAATRYGEVDIQAGNRGTDLPGAVAADWKIFVRTKPGQSAVTPSPRWPYSARKASEKPTNANLLT